jgi:hypothetical protein
MYLDIALVDDAVLADLTAYMNSLGFAYGGTVTTGLVPIQQKYSIQSAKLSLGIGSHVIVPAPPAGYLRMVGSPNLSSTQVPGAYLLPSDGVDTGATVGTWDGTLKVGAKTVAWMPVVSDIALLEANLIYLLPGENLTLDITAFGVGPDRVVGRVSWYDVPDTDTLTVRQDILDTLVADVIPAVPAGKTLLPLFDLTGPTLPPGAGLFLLNSDDIAHNFEFQLMDGAVPLRDTSIFSVFTALPQSFTCLYELRPMPAGVRATIRMQEAVSTVAPTVMGSFQYV